MLKSLITLLTLLVLQVSWANDLRPASCQEAAERLMSDRFDVEMDISGSIMPIFEDLVTTGDSSMVNFSGFLLDEEGNRINYNQDFVLTENPLGCAFNFEDIEIFYNFRGDLLVAIADFGLELRFFPQKD